MTERTRFENLKFTDDFMFCTVLQTNEDLCKELVELILDIKIKGIVQVEKQKSIELTADGRGVRFDVYLEDGNDTIYDIEMQAIDRGDLRRRSRYYQGMIDLDYLEKVKEAIAKSLWRKEYMTYKEI